MFKRMKNNWKKAEAATIVQNLLAEAKSIGWFSRDPAYIANVLVGALWEQMPDALEGKFGTRPHKLAIAASSLGATILLEDDWGSDTPGIKFAFIKIMQEISVNGPLYGLDQTDYFILEDAQKVFSRASAELGAPMLEEIEKAFRGPDEGRGSKSSEAVLKRAIFMHEQKKRISVSAESDASLTEANIVAFFSMSVGRYAALYATGSPIDRSTPDINKNALAIVFAIVAGQVASQTVGESEGAGALNVDPLEFIGPLIHMENADESTLNASFEKANRVYQDAYEFEEIREMVVRCIERAQFQSFEDIKVDLTKCAKEVYALILSAQTGGRY